MSSVTSYNSEKHSRWQAQWLHFLLNNAYLRDSSYQAQYDDTMDRVGS